MKAWHGSKWIRREKRLAIYIRDGFTCMCCGRDLRNAEPHDITLDHLRCRCREGSNEATNLVTICRRCNSARGSKKWIEFYPAGAHARVRAAIRRVLNIELAKSLLTAKRNNTGDDDQ